MFGWIGTFILGIGYYSLSKMGRLMPFAAGRGWVSWALWTCGITLRWLANVVQWEWRVLLPLSAALELAGFLIFFLTVSRHKPRAGDGLKPAMETWMKLVIASTAALLLVLLMNFVLAGQSAWQGASPAIPHWLDQRYLFLAAWGFPVLAVWGFNARWLPVFLGLRESSGGGLLVALAIAAAGIAAALMGGMLAAVLLLAAAAVSATLALRVLEPSRQPAKTLGVCSTFPEFVRGAYLWLIAAAGLGIYAALADTHGGIWGSSRHALTVGFLAVMVFAIGQRLLPAFCGMRVLYSPRLMFASLALLNLGCLLRVASEIPAYERNVTQAWAVLPFSALTELTA